MHYAKLKKVARILSAKLREALWRYRRIAGATAATHLLDRPTELDLLKPRNSLRSNLATKSIAPRPLISALTRTVIADRIGIGTGSLESTRLQRKPVRLDLMSKPRIDALIGVNPEITHLRTGRATLGLIRQVPAGIAAFIDDPLPALSR